MLYDSTFHLGLYHLGETKPFVGGEMLEVLWALRSHCHSVRKGV